MEASLTKSSGFKTSTLGVLELGTNSLKLHFYTDVLDRVEAHRVEWDIGFEVYSSRRISEKTISATISQVQALLSEHGINPARGPVLGIATGAFRDAENTAMLLDRVYEEIGAPIRVLTVDEEALLLIEGASGLVPERPGMAFDLGGGSLEMVYFGANGNWLRENLPLGAIRILQLASLALGEWDEGTARQWIAKGLQNARAFQLPVVHGTGGTVKAIAQVAGTPTIHVEVVRGIEEEARRVGPPAELGKRRQELFLPGVMVVRRLLEHVGAKTLQFTRTDLGEVLLGRLRPFRGALRGRLISDLLHGAVISDFRHRLQV